MVVARLEEYGNIVVMQFNTLHPSSDKVKLRRALLPTIDQVDFMDAAMGGDQELSRTGVDVFTPGFPLANMASQYSSGAPQGDPAFAARYLFIYSPYGFERHLVRRQ